MDNTAALWGIILSADLDERHIGIIGFNAGRTLPPDQITAFGRLDWGGKLTEARSLFSLIVMQKALVFGKMTGDDTIPLQRAWAEKKPVDEFSLFVSREVGPDFIAVTLQGVSITNVQVMTVGLLQFDLVTLTGKTAWMGESPARQEPKPDGKPAAGWGYGRRYGGYGYRGYGGGRYGYR